MLHTTVQTVPFSDPGTGLVDFEQCVVPVKAEYVCFNGKKTNSFSVFSTDTLLSNGQLDFMQRLETGYQRLVFPVQRSRMDLPGGVDICF